MTKNLSMFKESAQRGGLIRPSVFKSMLIKCIWGELTTTVLDSDDEHGKVVGIFLTCT